MSSHMERRKDTRQDIQLHVEFAPVSPYGTSVTRTGLTQNVSAGGVYFHTSMASALREQSNLTVRIAIPGPTEDPGTPLALTARAQVRRIHKTGQAASPDGPMYGVAVMFDHRPNIRMGHDFWLIEDE